MLLVKLVAFAVILVSMLFLYLAQRERMSTRRNSRRRQFKPRWSRHRARTGLRRRRINFRR